MERIRRTCDYCGTVRYLPRQESYYVGKCTHCGDRHYTDERVEVADYYGGAPDFIEKKPDYEPY